MHENQEETRVLCENWINVKIPTDLFCPQGVPYNMGVHGAVPTFDFVNDQLLKFTRRATRDSTTKKKI
jgi:hypothetical protein